MFVRLNFDKQIGRTMAIVVLLSLVFEIGCGRSGKPDERIAAPKIIMTPSGVEMVLIPAGSFEMGGRSDQANETPVHSVKVDAFLMDRTEVTQDQMARLEISDMSHFKNPKNPVEMISWPQAILFCNRRSEAENLTPCYNEESTECNYEASGYRLPTEAEWEYACRAGSSSAYSFGGDQQRLREYAWFAENSDKKTHVVAQKKPNSWGLYDMYGNVMEWCNDIYDKDYYRESPMDNPRGPASGKLYVLRGGSWLSQSRQVRSSARMADIPGFVDTCLARDAIGFRCVRKAPWDMQ